MSDAIPEAPNRNTLPVAHIMGLPVSCAARDDVLREMTRAIDARETGHFISITNTESMYHGLRIAEHGEYIRKCDFSLCDGVGVIVGGYSWGHRIPRFNGPILQLLASEHGVSRGWRHFFYGGKEGVADEMARRLKEKYPGLVVCGTYCPPFRELTAEEDAQVVKLINEAKPDIVWCGLGLLKQERWVASHLRSIHAPWLIGVGAAFDYHSGAIPWAPAPLRAMGLEWAFRLVIQPKLRAKRYWWSLIYVIESFFGGLFSLQFLRKNHQTQIQQS